MAETIIGRKEWPKKIHVGRVLMFIGCVLFFVNAFFNLLDFMIAVFSPAIAQISELTEIMEETYLAAWADPIGAIRFIFTPFMIAFLVISGIGGISWLRDKGPFISVAPLMAMISLVLILGNFFIDMRRLLMSGNWFQFIVDLLDIQLTCGIYFIGWLIAKNQLD